MTSNTDGAAEEAPWITFYRLQGCPFCERVTRTLQELDVPYRSRFVEPFHSKRDVVKRVAGVRTVPVIVDERTGVTMAESANVVDYLEATYGDGATGSGGVETDPEPATDGGRVDAGDGDGGSRPVDGDGGGRPVDGDGGGHPVDGDGGGHRTDAGGED